MSSNCLWSDWPLINIVSLQLWLYQETGMGPNGPAKSLGAPTAVSQGMGLKQMCKLAPGKSECKSEILRWECSEDRNSTEMLIFPSLLSGFALRYCKHLKNKSTAGGSPLRHWQPGPCSSREHPDATGLPCSSESVGRLPMLSPCCNAPRSLRH